MGYDRQRHGKGGTRWLELCAICRGWEVAVGVRLLVMSGLSKVSTDEIFCQQCMLRVLLRVLLAGRTDEPIGSITR